MFLPSPKMIGVAAVGILIAALVGAAYVAKSHYNKLVEDRDRLTLQVALKDGALIQLRSDIDSANLRADAAQERTEKFQLKMIEAGERVRETRELFANSDFYGLLQAEPGRITPLMQKATTKTLREMASIANSIRYVPPPAEEEVPE